MDVIRSRGSSVSIVTRLRAGRPVFDSWQGQWWDFFFCPPRRPDRLCGPPSVQSNGYGGGGLFRPGVKRLGRGSDHSSPSSAELRMRGAIPPLPHTFYGVLHNYVKLRMDLVNGYINFILYFVTYDAAPLRNLIIFIWECIQKFPDRPPGTRTASGTDLCH
jgi:hypothetical protein